MLCLALPGAGWARVLDRLPCPQEAPHCASDAPAHHCACCEKGACACQISEDEVPAKPLPILPPRTTTGGDMIFFDLPQTAGFLKPVVAAVRPKAPTAAERAALDAQTVPLYIRHCSQLW